MLKVFFSYSHKDELFRDEIEKHLAVLKHQGIIDAWHDRRIVAGDSFEGAIDENLKNADIILLLVSADFLSSKYCYDVEMKLAMDRNAAGDARIIPVILHPCAWHSSPIGKLLAVPKDGTPISMFENKHQAFLEVANAVQAATESNADNVGPSQSKTIKHDTLPDGLPLEKVEKLIDTKSITPSLAQVEIAKQLPIIKSSAATERQSGQIEHVVFLIHGIRSYGTWHQTVRNAFASEGVKIVPVKYGWLPALRFIAPWDTAKKPMKRVYKEIRSMMEDFPDAKFSVIAHSFGTHLLTRILAEDEFDDIKLWRIVLCGSVVKNDFSWKDVKANIGDPNIANKSRFIVNDFGSGDFLPVLARSAGWRYGTAGTHGFGGGFVTDRIHRGGHGLFFDEAFIKEWWKPFIIDAKDPKEKTDVIGEGSDIPWYLRWVTIFPLRFMQILLPLLIAVLLALFLRPQPESVTPNNFEGFMKEYRKLVEAKEAGQLKGGTVEKQSDDEFAKFANRNRDKLVTDWTCFFVTEKPAFDGKRVIVVRWDREQQDQHAERFYCVDALFRDTAPRLESNLVEGDEMRMNGIVKAINSSYGVSIEESDFQLKPTMTKSGNR